MWMWGASGGSRSPPRAKSSDTRAASHRTRCEHDNGGSGVPSAMQLRVSRAWDASMASLITNAVQAGPGAPGMAVWPQARFQFGTAWEYDTFRDAMKVGRAHGGGEGEGAWHTSHALAGAAHPTIAQRAECLWDGRMLAETLQSFLAINVDTLPDYSAVATASGMPPGVGAFALTPSMIAPRTLPGDGSLAPGDGADGGDGVVRWLARVGADAAPATGRYGGDDGEYAAGGGTAVWMGRCRGLGDEAGKEDVAAWEMDVMQESADWSRYLAANRDPTPASRAVLDGLPDPAAAGAGGGATNSRHGDPADGGGARRGPADPGRPKRPMAACTTDVSSTAVIDPAVMASGVLAFNRTCHICHHPRGWGYMCPLHAAAAAAGEKRQVSAHPTCARCVQLQTGLSFDDVRTGAVVYECIVCTGACNCASCRRRRGGGVTPAGAARGEGTAPAVPATPAPSPPAVVRASSRATSIPGVGTGGGVNASTSSQYAPATVFTSSLLSFRPAITPTLTPLHTIVLLSSQMHPRASTPCASSMVGQLDDSGVAHAGNVHRRKARLDGDAGGGGMGPTVVGLGGEGRGGGGGTPVGAGGGMLRQHLQDLAAMYRRCDGVPMPACRSMRLELPRIASRAELTRFGSDLPPACCGVAEYHAGLSRDARLRRKYCIAPATAATALGVVRPFADTDFMPTGLTLPHASTITQPAPAMPSSLAPSPTAHTVFMPTDDGSTAVSTALVPLPSCLDGGAAGAVRTSPPGCTQPLFTDDASLRAMEAMAGGGGGGCGSSGGGAAAKPAMRHGDGGGGAVEGFVATTAITPATVRCRLCKGTESAASSRRRIIGIHPFIPVDPRGMLVLICHECYGTVLKKREEAAREGQLHDTDDGCERLCAMCGDMGAPSIGIRIHSCSARRCPRGYCDTCLDRHLLTPEEKRTLLGLRDWLCPPCHVASRAIIATFQARPPPPPIATPLPVPPALVVSPTPPPVTPATATATATATAAATASTPVAAVPLEHGVSGVGSKRGRPPTTAASCATVPSSQRPRPSHKGHGGRASSVEREGGNADSMAELEEEMDAEERALMDRMKAGTRGRPRALAPATPPPPTTTATPAKLFALYVAMVRARSRAWPGGTEDVCFVCRDGGDLLECDATLPSPTCSCSKVYHEACIPANARPAEDDSVPWRCPRHHCAQCAGPAAYMCRYCPAALCKEHAPGTGQWASVALLAPPTAAPHSSKLYTPDLPPGVTLMVCPTCRTGLVHGMLDGSIPTDAHEVKCWRESAEVVAEEAGTTSKHRPIRPKGSGKPRVGMAAGGSALVQSPSDMGHDLQPSTTALAPRPAVADDMLPMADGVDASGGAAAKGAMAPESAALDGTGAAATGRTVTPAAHSVDVEGTASV